jgi:hypothetical protein
VIAAFVSRLVGLCHSLLLAAFALSSSLKHALARTHPPQPNEAFRKHWQTLDLPFAGPGEPKRELLLPRSKLDMEGTYDADVVTWPMKIEIVTQMLSRGLELGPQNWTAPGLHPVLFMFGRQVNVRPNFVPIHGMIYDELIVAIPYVQWDDNRYAYRGPYVCSPRLYLDRLLPTLLGRLVGYPKRVAHTRADEGTFQVRDLRHNSSLIRGSFFSRGRAGKMGDFPLFGATAALLRQPILGRALLVGPYLGTFLNFELDKALIQAVGAELWIERPFLRGLQVGSHQAPGVDEVALGAFRFIVPWRMGPPFEPSSPKANLAG